MSHSTVPRSSAEAKRKIPGEETPGASGGATGSAGERPSGKLSLKVRLRRDRLLLLMTLPAIALVLLFNYVPILGNVVAFQDYDPYISDNGVVSMLNSPFV
ncbi:sugar ABC transporter permease, partial [Streptomyces sp. ISL-14]|nr:sugar ABC transporter permease [Streptomyces sp. ISL-14]